MKTTVERILILLLSVLFLSPSVSKSEASYTPKLGMNMDEYILKYNALPATLGSPYKSLEKPAFWSEFEGYQVAFFYPENDSAVALLLMSADKSNTKSTKAGLDVVQVFSFAKENWIPLINITKRCASIFAEEFFGVSMASLSIIDALNYYYENNLEKQGYTSYRSLNSDETIALSFGYSDGYYFMITSLDDAK